MKHLKSYEQQNYNKYYWIVKNTKDEISKFLKKMNCPEKYIRILINITPEKYIFIGHDESNLKNLNNGFGWMRFKDSLKCEYYENNNYKFSGTIGLSKSDIIEIEISKNTNKYNL